MAFYLYAGDCPKCGKWNRKEYRRHPRQNSVVVPCGQCGSPCALRLSVYQK